MKFEKKFAELLVVALIITGLCGSLAVMELRAEEPRRAVVAMEMLLGKHLIIPKIHDWNYYNKPPLFNWIMAGFFKLSGSFSEVWVRLPSLLSFLITAFLVFKLVSKFFDKRTAYIAAFLFLTSVDILFYGAVDSGEIDLFLTLLTFLQGCVIFNCSQKQKWLSLFLFSYFITALGILTKGLPSLIIQGLTLTIWFIYIKEFKKLFSWQHAAGILLCIAIVVSYFFAYNQHENAITFILQLTNESTQRSAFENATKEIIINILQAPFQLFYIALPGSAMLLYLFKKDVRTKLKQNQLYVFSLIFMLINIVPYFISSDTANRYLYPAFPFIAIMGAIVYNAASLSSRAIKYTTLLKIFSFLALLRIGYNIWGIPYQIKTSDNLIYAGLSQRLLHYSHGNPIYLTGNPEKLIADPTLPFVDIKADTAYVPPYVPFQLPYYITKSTKHIMQYDPVPQKGNYYLTPIDFLKDKKATIYFQFFDNWQQRELALVKFQ